MNSENQPDHGHKSALKVNPGIEQPSSINEAGVQAFRTKRKSQLKVDDYVKGIISGNRIILSKAITLIESSLAEHFKTAQQVIEKCVPYSGNSHRVGITGVPGVGKSTFIEALGKYLTGQGNKIAVLAVDPSSEISKGSILGDKTRMEQLAVDPNAFVRPSPSAGSLGGVARKTREIIVLCEAAGFDIILVETVGVGQSETAVHSMVDFFLLLMLAGAGDELQGIKRGIIEMCDGMIINKADGDNINKARAAKVQYQNALHLFPLPTTGWAPKVEICSAIQKTGISKVWEMICQHRDLLKANGQFFIKRNHQQKSRMLESINQTLSDQFYNNAEVIRLMPQIEIQLAQSKITSYQAANMLLNAYFSDFKKHG
jgi:LAO/AO transport system kinase